MKFKKCKKCSNLKLYREFYKAKRLKDGHESICIECKKEYNKKYYKDPVRRKARNDRRKELENNSKIICCESGCDNNVYGTRKLCKKHYQKQWYEGKIIKKLICSIDKCEKPSYGKKRVCIGHYNRELSGNKDLSPIRKKNKQGSGSINKSGYKIITKNNKPILEHRYIMAEYLGRELLSCERVHHINGNKLDNKVSNLELWTTSHPYGQRVEDKLKWAHEIIDFYELGIDEKAIVTFEPEEDEFPEASPQASSSSSKEEKDTDSPEPEKAGVGVGSTGAGDGM